MIDPYGDSGVERAVGCVVDQDRGSLPYALIHGESLVACASWALGESGVTPVDYSTTWSGIQRGEEPFMLHDALCPMTPATFLAACLVRCVESGAVVAAFRPVLDPATEGCERAVTSPVVLPAAVVAALDDVPSYDFAALVAALDARFDIVWVEAPPDGRRVTTESEVRELEALTGAPLQP
jgi:hypothetical protein